MEKQRRTVFAITSSNILSVFTRDGGRRSKLGRDVSRNRSGARPPVWVTRGAACGFVGGQPLLTKPWWWAPGKIMRRPEIDWRGKHIKRISDLCDGDGDGSSGFNTYDSIGTDDDGDLK